MTTPREIFELASLLSQRAGANEAVFRSAASRAYYSIYHLMGQELGPPDYWQKSGSHKLVHDEVLSQPIVCDEFVRLAKGRFKSLLDNRVHADYRLNQTFTTHQVQESVIRAQQIFDAFGN